MTQAWQKRALERQEFLKKLLDEFYDEAEQEQVQSMPPFWLAFLILDYLSWRARGSYGHVQGTGKERFERVLEEISLFARADEERDALLAELLGSLVGAIEADFSGMLRTKEIVDPRTIFRASSATNEVPLAGGEA